MNLNIVIPVLNEENDLKPGVETTLDFLKTTSWRDHFEITIADNGSTDRTGEIAKDLCNSYENVNYFKVSPTRSMEVGPMPRAGTFTTRRSRRSSALL